MYETIQQLYILPTILSIEIYSMKQLAFQYNVCCYFVSFA